MSELTETRTPYEYAVEFAAKALEEGWHALQDEEVPERYRKRAAAALIETHYKLISKLSDKGWAFSAFPWER